MYRKVLALALAGVLAFSVPAMAAPSSWAEAEVKTAITVGIVPKNIQEEYQSAITRAEFCEMAMQFWTRLTGKEMPSATATFTDTDNPSVAAAQSLGIVQGESETQFSPDKPVTRQEICVMLRNALVSACPNVALPEVYVNTFPDASSVADWAMEAVQGMNLFAVMLGDENGNIRPLGNTTREEAILLTYRLFATQAMTQQEYVEKFLMPVSGNTHDNMLSGAYAVGVGGGPVYYGGESGIFAVGSDKPVVAKPVKSFLAYAETIYYIDNAGAIYAVKLATGEETKVSDGPADQIAIYNGAMYYRNAGSPAFRMPIDTMEAAPFTPGPAELPLVYGNHIYYSDNQAIFVHNADGTFTTLFSGINRNLCVRDNMFYFLNQNGLICTADLTGANYGVVSRLPVKSYCFTRDCIIAIGQEDGAVYKIDYKGRYAIKMYADTYESINTYDDYVYARDAGGGIYKFSNNATEKAKIN